MIDWGLGVYLGLKLGFILIVLAAEFYFLVVVKYTEGEMDRAEFIILFVITVLCIVIPVANLKNFALGLWPVVPVPLFYGIFRVLEHIQIEKTDKELTEKDIRNLENRMVKNPEIPESYLMLGDIYLKNRDEIKKWAIKGFFAVVLLVVLMKIFLTPGPLFISVFFFLLAIYLILRKFFTW